MTSQCPADCRKTLSQSIELSREQFANGEFVTDEECFAECEKMLDEMDAAALRADVAAAEAELDAGLGIPHAELKRQIAAETEEAFRFLGI